MARYFKHFMIPFIVIGVFMVITIALRISTGKPFFGIGEEITYKRTNKESKTDERVFDYANQLTASEEKSLRDLIAESEKSCGCDIMLVTLDDASISTDSAMMNWADDFYDDLKMGYDKPWGDGCIYVDNWANGYVWFSTCGACEYGYSSYEIDSLIDGVCSDVNTNTYGAYVRYVNNVTKHMKRYREGGMDGIPMLYFFFAAVIVTLIYALVSIWGRKGKRTTTASTYLGNQLGQQLFTDQRDVFLTKHVTHHTISSSSGGGGGGGHHISSGGHSHGGGGGRH